MAFLRALREQRNEAIATIAAHARAQLPGELIGENWARFLDTATGIPYYYDRQNRQAYWTMPSDVAQALVGDATAQIHGAPPPDADAEAAATNTLETQLASAGIFEVRGPVIVSTS